MPLRDLRGHRRVFELLTGAIGRGALPPTLLFDGPEGVGKRAAAVAVAQALNCLQPASGDACGACTACRRIARAAHPDVVLIEPEESGAIKIDTIRDEVLQKTAYRPFEGRWRVFIIDEADALVVGAQDALLKTLEEPAAGSILTLVTARADALLPTVRSRCYRLRFGRLTEADIASVLRERHGFSERDARAAAVIADGSVSRALAAQEGDLADARDAAARLLRTVATGRVPQRIEGGKEFVAGARAGLADRGVVADRLRALSSMLRDLEILATRAQDAWLANADLREQLLQPLLPAFAGGRALRAFSAVDRALFALERNASQKIVGDWIALEI